MTRLFVCGAMLLALSACASASVESVELASTLEEKVYCPKAPGMVQGPFVPEESTARKIATAVIETLPSSKSGKEFSIVVEDHGNSWGVWQKWMPPQKLDDGPDAIAIWRGGGGVQMRIAKCDGAISELHNQR